jgi:NTE family protein
VKKITVILSGIGISGYSCIALMEFFDKYQIKPSLIVGCSGGALIAGLWAKGYGPQAALDIITRSVHISEKINIDLLTSAFFFKHPTGNHPKDHALLKVQPLQKMYHDIFENQFIEHLPVQTIFQTTNVDTGQMHFVRKGSLADAVYASSALLPFYPPIKMDTLWLADGAFSEFLPLATVLDEHSDVIIVIDIQASLNEKPNNFMLYYAQFVQKALKIASGPRTALVYDLHNNDILMIPIKIVYTKEEHILHQLLDSARKNIAAKSSIILETIGV